MSRGVCLDRRKRYEVAHGEGDPVSTTKGNIYIDDNNETTLWIKGTDELWVKSGAEGWWTRTSDILSPLNPGDGLLVNATAVTADSISLTTAGGIDLNSTGLLRTQCGVFDLDASDYINIDSLSHIYIGNGESTYISIGGSGQTNTITMTSNLGGFNLITEDAANGYMDFQSGKDLAVSAVTDMTFKSNTSWTNADGGITLTNGSFASESGSIAGVSDLGNGDVEVAVNGSHNLRLGETVTLTDTTGYDGTYVVTGLREGALWDIYFHITAVYSASSTGNWDKTESIGDDGPSFIKIGSHDSWNEPLHLYSSYSDILIETDAAACSTDIILRSCDDITLDATGSCWINSAWTSTIKMDANNIDPQTLTLQATNAHATGDGYLALVADEVFINGTQCVTQTFATNTVLTITVTNGLITSIV